MVLYALYVCLLHSRFIENHPIDLEAMNPSFFRWFYHREKPVVSGGGAKQEEGWWGSLSDDASMEWRCGGDGIRWMASGSGGSYSTSEEGEAQSI
jgi:hypothetical protein